MKRPFQDTCFSQNTILVTRKFPEPNSKSALAYFNQIKNTDLDNTVVQRAAKSFKTLMEDPNAEEYAKKAEEK